VGTASAGSVREVCADGCGCSRCAFSLSSQLPGVSRPTEAKNYDLFVQQAAAGAIGMVWAKRPDGASQPIAMHCRKRGFADRVLRLLRTLASSCSGRGCAIVRRWASPHLLPAANRPRLRSESPTAAAVGSSRSRAPPASTSVGSQKPVVTE